MLVEYTPPPTIKDFMMDDSLVRAIIGPVGSGKSSGSCVEIVRRAFLQEPDNDGVRRIRGAAIRNTYRELEDTTLRTWLDWFPEHTGSGEPGWGHYKEGKKTYILGRDRKDNKLIQLDDGTSVYCELLFRALEKPDDTKKLLSLDLTLAWINEFREIPYEVLRALVARMGRYPSKKNGPGATYKGVMADSNPYDVDSDYYRLFEEGEDEEVNEMYEKLGVEPPSFSLYSQPSGMSPNAENLENLPDGYAYYVNMIETAKKSGKGQNWIDVHVHGKFGFTYEGRSVYRDAFSEDNHRSPGPLRHIPSRTIAVGFDPGIGGTAAVYTQTDIVGRWSVLGELVAEEVGATEFIPMMASDLKRRFGVSPMEVVIYADPAIDQRSQINMKTYKSMLIDAGFRVYPSEKGVDIRIESVRSVLNRNIDGYPALNVDKSCSKLLRGFMGGYCFRRMQVSGERYTEKPDKNEFSHVHDALQYVVAYFEGPALKGGHRRAWPQMGSRHQSTEPHKMKINWSPY